MNLFFKSKPSEYNNRLEQILDNKMYSTIVKNLLLSMLYKIETAFKDYNEVKVDSDTKSNIIERMLYIISEECEHIVAVTPKTEAAKVLDEENVSYKIDANKKSILVYANEKDICSALIALDFMARRNRYKEERKELNFKNIENDYLYNVVTDMFLRAETMNYSEIIRDFTGWAWTQETKDIDSIAFNLIYQDLLLLLGYKNVKELFKDYERDKFQEFISRNSGENALVEYSKPLINFKFLNKLKQKELEIERQKYFEEQLKNQNEKKMREQIKKNLILKVEAEEQIKEEYRNKIREVLEKEYGKRDSYNLINNIYIIMLAEEMRLDEKVIKKVEARYKELTKELTLMKNNKEYLQMAKKEAYFATTRIKQIEKIFRDKKLFNEEYVIKNKQRRNGEKVLDANELVLLLKKEEENEIYKLVKYSKFLKAENFIKIREDLLREFSIIKTAFTIYKNNKIANALVALQIETTKLLKKQIEKYKAKERVIDQIYKLRYFNNLAITKKSNCYQVEQLVGAMQEITNILIDKAIDKKVIENISDSISLCYNILRPVFYSRIIYLNNVSIKVQKIRERQNGSNKKDKLSTIRVILNESGEEESDYQALVTNLKMIKIRLNRKIDLFL